MTYYEKLVCQAARAMAQHPRSTVVLDAETLQVTRSAQSAAAIAKELEHGAAQGRTSVVLRKPRKPESWIL